MPSEAYTHDRSADGGKQLNSGAAGSGPTSGKRFSLSRAESSRVATSLPTLAASPQSPAPFSTPVDYRPSFRRSIAVMSRRRMAVADDTLRKVPPQSLEAEEAVVGGILLDNTALDRVIEIIGPDDFYRGA